MKPKKSNKFSLTVRYSDEVRILIVDGMEIRSVKVPSTMKTVTIKRGRK